MSQLNESQRQASILMQSIQKKLVTLFEPKQQSRDPIIPDISISAVVHNSGVRTTQKMQINELDCSQLKPISTPQKQQHTSVKASSSVLNQINKMQAFYVDKIRQLEVKVDRLEMSNQDLQAENEALKLSLKNLQQQLKKQLAFNQKSIDSAVSEMKGKMMSRFGEEATELYIETEKQKELLKGELYKEKTMRMQLEDQMKALKQEKDNLEGFYCSLVENHRRLLKADIDRNRASLLQNASLHKSNLYKSSTAEHLQTSSAKKTQSQSQSQSARQEKELLQTELSRVRHQSKQLRKSQRKVQKQLPYVASEIKIIKNKLKSK